MRIVVGARGAGKSVDCVRWAAQDPGRRVVVVANHSRARDLIAVARTRYPKLDVNWGRVFVGPDPTSLRGRDVEVYVDEFESVLASLLGAPVAGVTTTAEIYDLGERA